MQKWLQLSVSGILVPSGPIVEIRKPVVTELAAGLPCNSITAIMAGTVIGVLVFVLHDLHSYLLRWA